MFANSLSWLHTPYQLEWSYRVRHSSTPDNCFPCHNILKEEEDGLKRGTRPQAQRNQASNRKSTMRCLLFYMWSVWFRLCRRTARHLRQRIVEHKNSAIGKHFSTAHGDTSLLKESQFRFLKKCQGKLYCLVYEMPFIKQPNPCLNTQTDSRKTLCLKEHSITYYLFSI